MICRDDGDRSRSDHTHGRCTCIAGLQRSEFLSARWWAVKSLAFDKGSNSFSDLVKKYGGDIPPGAMRTELNEDRRNAVVEGEDGEVEGDKEKRRPGKKFMSD